MRCACTYVCGEVCVLVWSGVRVSSGVRACGQVCVCTFAVGSREAGVADAGAEVALPAAVAVRHGADID